MSRLRVYGLIAFVLVAIASTLYALPVSAHDITYYADDTYETIVGEHYVSCSGSESWGVRSAYFDTVSWACATGEVIGPCTRKYCPGWSSYSPVPAGVDGGPPNWDWDCQTWSCEF
jgi:hypothetical protein